MRHCHIAPLHQLDISHNSITVDNAFPTCFGGGQVKTLNTDTDTDTGCKLDFSYGCATMYVCMYVMK